MKKEVKINVHFSSNVVESDTFRRDLLLVFQYNYCVTTTIPLLPR